MTAPAGDSPRWEKVSWWSFPRAWRLDGRAGDMAATAIDKASSEGRQQVGPLEVADLVVFGLRMRCEPWWRAAPVPARLIIGWAGVTGGLILTVAATVRPWVAPPDPIAPVGTVSRPVLLLALWGVVAVAVVLRRPAVVRAAAAGVLVAIPVSLFSPTSPTLTGVPSLAGAHGLLLFDPNLAWSVEFYLGLPIWMCAWLALAASPVVRTPTPARALLIVAAGLMGAGLTRVHSAAPNGLVWLGAPYYIGPAAVTGLLIAAGVGVLLLFVNPRSTPAALIAAGPWVVPASITLIGPGHLAVFVWLATWLTLAMASGLAWRRFNQAQPVLV